MKRPMKDNYHRRLEYLEHEKMLSSTSRVQVSKTSNLQQNNLNANCALLSTIFVTCILLWICLIWNNSHPISYNNVSKYELYSKHPNSLTNNTSYWYTRRIGMEKHPKKALWDLLGSMKSPSLYTKFMIDGQLFNLEVDTGSFLTWFRCDYKSYQEKIISSTDPYCLKVTGKHFKATNLNDNDPQFEGMNGNPCLYQIVYEDKSQSNGVIVKANIQLHIINLMTGVGEIQLSETYLGCSIKDFNPIGEYKDVVDGLLGLSRSTYGVQMSFSKHGIPLIFGFCFEDYFSKYNEAKVGYLYFGNLHDPHSKAQTKWIDISEEYVFGDETYELRVLELWIDEDINIPINANLMIDVGAPLTFIETTLFETIIHYISESALNAGYIEYKEEMRHFKCWNFPEPLDESSSTLEMISFDFPKLIFKFVNGEALTISPTNYLAFYEFMENGICANMRKFDERIEYPTNTIVLGARMLVEHLIIFDNENFFVALWHCLNVNSTRKENMDYKNYHVKSLRNICKDDIQKILLYLFIP